MSWLCRIIDALTFALKIQKTAHGSKAKVHIAGVSNFTNRERGAVMPTGSHTSRLFGKSPSQFDQIRIFFLPISVGIQRASSGHPAGV
jgi:hypothetical protein